METKKSFIITIIICFFIVVFFLFKDEVFEQINLLIYPPEEYMSRHVSDVVLKELPQEKCVYEGRLLKEKCYIEVKRPKEEVEKEIKDVKERDHRERVGLRREIKDINKKIKERPTTSLYRERGDMRFKEMYVYRDLKKADQFVPDFIKAAEGDPTDWKSSALAGFGLTISGDFVKAEEYLRQSILRKPNTFAYFWLCDLLLKQENYSGALKALTQAEKLFKTEYKPMEIKFKHEDIRPFVYHIYDTTLDYYRNTIENSIYVVRKMLKENPKLKMKAIID